MNYQKLQIDFDRNSKIGKKRMLVWFGNLLCRFPLILVDLLSIKDDVLSDVPLVNKKNACSGNSAGSIAESVGLRSVDTYLCYKISDINQLERLDDHYCYTFPKMYRFALNEDHHSVAALDDETTNKFQCAEVEEIEESITNPLIVRDS